MPPPNDVKSRPVSEPTSDATLRLQLLGIGIGAMRSPRYRPAGLLVEYDGTRVMLEGGRVPRRQDRSTLGWSPTIGAN